MIPGIATHLQGLSDLVPGKTHSFIIMEDQVEKKVKYEDSSLSEGNDKVKKARIDSSDVRLITLHPPVLV